MRLRVSSEIRIGDEADDELLDERARTAVAWLFKARSSPHPRIRRRTLAWSHPSTPTE
jgi:hypothetical protein